GTIGSDQTICSGATPSAFTSSASASGGTGTISYQWQSSTTSTSAGFANVASATSTTYAPSALTQTTYYRRRAVTSGNDTAYTSALTVTVNATTVGGSVAGGATVCTGTNSTALTLSGHTGTIVRWQSATNAGFTTGLTNIASTSGLTSYTATNLTATTYYRAVLKSGVCDTAFSSGATVTVDPASVGGSISGGASVCSGTNSTALTLSGHTGTIVRWQSATNAGFTTGLTNIASTNGLTSYTATNLTATTYYRAVLKSGVCDTAFSSGATVTVNPLPATPTSGVNGARTGTGTVGISASVGSGETIDWYADATGGSVLSGGTGTTSFTTPSISTTTTYYAQARNTTTGCISSARLAVIATINSALSAGTIGSDQTICSGATPSAFTSSASASGGTGTISYQWQSSTTSTSAG
ncbi:MAG: hypothetical protein ACK45U_02455, partial [bacterium]